MNIFQPNELHFLQLLARQYPTVQAASTEIIRLRGILNLPKATEYFMSDIHGEYEAFLHILNSCSGEIRNKLDEHFGETLTAVEKNDIATLIHYPSAKLTLMADQVDDLDAWYRVTLHQLVQLCRYVSIKHTRNKVRTFMPKGYEQIVDELIHMRDEDGSKRLQFEHLIDNIIQIGQANDVIVWAGAEIPHHSN